ncbi:MAG: PQQ-dependent sugar dehydrogenase [Streptosporangiales bacterium]
MRTTRGARAVPVAVALAVAAFSGCQASGSGEPTSGSSSSTGSTAVASSSHSPRPSATPAHPGKPQVIVKNLDVPWGVAFLPNDAALVSERNTHKIKRIAPGGKVTTVGKVSGVTDDTSEGGLLGLALSPTYDLDHLVYAYITTDTGNRIVRFRYDKRGISRQESVFTGIPKATIHDGGRIKFGPDGMLYVTTGDATRAERAQDPKYLGGKVLRMTPDGEPVPGNPFSDSVVWTVGHRNPQGLAWGPGKDPTLYEAEFGQNALDEVNALHPGENYGWPDVEGTIGPKKEKFTPPLVTWPTDKASPSGLAYAADSLWLATLQGENVYRMRVHGDGSVGKPRALLDDRYGRLRTIVTAPDGSLWVTTSNRDGRGSPTKSDDRIIRIPLHQKGSPTSPSPTGSV